jgi:hypothetical protein
MTIDIVTLFDKLLNPMTDISFRNSIKNLYRYRIRTLTCLIKNRDKDILSVHSI